MHAFTVIVNVILVISLGITEAVEEFRGAVVEYSPVYLTSSSKETVVENVKNYGNIVTTLKDKYTDLKIIVFPEFGLTSLEWLMQLDKSKIYGETIPEKNSEVTICNSTNNGVLSTLACIAKNKEVYIQFNIVESSKIANGTELLYNTNIVFSPKGTLVAKYRKYNLYGIENKLFAKPEKAGIEYFDTDFGVRFGTFTCFDIVFQSPAQDLINGDSKVSHVLFGSAWKNELPFFTAVQTFQAWSYGTNKVLLSAGLNNPKLGCTGTGIYLGKFSSDNSFDETSAQNQIKGNFAIVSYIPKSINVADYSSRSEVYTFYDSSKPENVPLKVATDKLEVYTIEPFSESTKLESIEGTLNLTLSTKTSVKKSVCNRGFCCDFEFNLTRGYCLDLALPNVNYKAGEEFGQFEYRLAAFNGVKNFDGYRTVGAQVCSIISCLDKTEGSCAKRTDINTVETVTEFGSYKFQRCFARFDDVIIKAKLNTSNSFVSSNILLSSDYYVTSMAGGNKLKRFGKTAQLSLYTLAKDGDTANNISPYAFKSKATITDPASINIYNRLYDFDGQPETKVPSSGSIFKSSATSLVILFLVSLLK